MEKQWGSGWQKHWYSLKATAVWILQMAWAVSTGTTSARYCQDGEDIWAGAAFQHQLCLLCSLHEKQLHHEGKQLRVTVPWSFTFSPGSVDLQLQRWLKMISTNNLNWPHGEILTNRKSNLSRKLQRNHSLSKYVIPVCDPWGIHTNLYQTRLSLLWRQNGTTTMLSELDKTFAQVQGSKCRLAEYQASLTTALAPKDTTAGMLEVNYAIVLEDPEKQSSSFVYL